MISAGDIGPAHRNIGKAFLNMGKFEPAIRSLEKARELTPEDPDIYFNLGLAYTLKDDFDAAVKNYKIVLEFDTNNIEARHNLAKAYRLMGRLEEAVSEFRAVLNQRPRHYRAMNGLANCYLIFKDYYAAVDLLREAVILAPDYDLAHHNLGVALKNLSFTEEANFHFAEAQRLGASDQAAFSHGDSVVQGSGRNPPNRVSGNPTYKMLAA
jgi:tetratricopeptide (TPR) repeat protein